MNRSFNGNPLREKSYKLALDAVVFSKNLIEKREYILSKQLMRSGTSVGANIEEAQHSRSKKDFISKYSISLQEAYECRFWIWLVEDSGYASKPEIQHLLDQLDEVIPILITSIKTIKERYCLA